MERSCDAYWCDPSMPDQYFIDAGQMSCWWIQHTFQEEKGVVTSADQQEADVTNIFSFLSRRTNKHLTNSQTSLTLISFNQLSECNN